MEYLPSIVAVLALAAVVVVLLISRDQEREAFLRGINFAIKETSAQSRDYQAMIGELTEKIQHPELPHPSLRAPTEPSEPPEHDPAFDRVGKVFPEDSGDNGAG